MKKIYVSPKTIITSSYLESALLGHSYGDADAKKNGFFEDDEDNQEVAPTDKSVWDDEKTWE